jgi:hypothetical protein
MGVAASLVGPAVGMLGSVIGGSGAKQQADAAAASDQYQAAIAWTNAKIAMQNSQSAIERGRAQVQGVGQQGHAEMGQLQANQSVSGIDMSSGSSVATRVGLGEIEKLKELTTYSDAQWTAHNFDLQVYQDSLKARGMEAAAQNEYAAGQMAEENSLIGGAGQFASKWGQFAQQGGFNGLF